MPAGAVVRPRTMCWSEPSVLRSNTFMHPSPRLLRFARNDNHLLWSLRGVQRRSNLDLTMQLDRGLALGLQQLRIDRQSANAFAGCCVDRVADRRCGRRHARFADTARQM